MEAGQRQRDGIQLVPCGDCNGNVRVKVPIELNGKIGLAHLIVVESTVYQAEGREVVVVETRFGRPVKNNEQAYRRETSVGEDWEPLDSGWLKEGMVVIENREGRFTQVQPSYEERAAAMARVVEVSFAESADLLIAPLESLRCQPTRLESVKLRCRLGRANIVVSLFPL
jgi:hypothetical protein